MPGHAFCSDCAVDFAVTGKCSCIQPSRAYSIVVPVFRERDNLPQFVSELLAVASEHLPDCEIIFVVDPPDDGSLAILMAAPRSMVRVLINEHRLGQYASMTRGIIEATGRVVLTLDCDGQNVPEDLPRVAREVERGVCAVACGIRNNRQDSALRRFDSAIVRTVMRIGSGRMIHDAGCNLRAYTFEAAQRIAFHAVARPDVWFPMWFNTLGLRIAEVRVSHRARPSGQGTKNGMATQVRQFKSILVESLKLLRATWRHRLVVRWLLFGERIGEF